MTEALTSLKTGIEQAIEIAGGQTNLALMVGCTQQNVSFWKRRGFAPLSRAVEIEAGTGVPRAKLVSPRIRRLLEPSTL